MKTEENADISFIDILKGHEGFIMPKILVESENIVKYNGIMFEKKDIKVDYDHNFSGDNIPTENPGFEDNDYMKENIYNDNSNFKKKHDFKDKIKENLNSKIVNKRESDIKKRRKKKNLDSFSTSQSKNNNEQTIYTQDNHDFNLSHQHVKLDSTFDTRSCDDIVLYRISSSYLAIYAASISKHFCLKEERHIDDFFIVRIVEYKSQYHIIAIVVGSETIFFKHDKELIFIFKIYIPILQLFPATESYSFFAEVFTDNHSELFQIFFLKDSKVSWNRIFCEKEILRNINKEDRYSDNFNSCKKSECSFIKNNLFVDVKNKGLQNQDTFYAKKEQKNTVKKDMPSVVIQNNNYSQKNSCQEKSIYKKNRDDSENIDVYNFLNSINKFKRSSQKTLRYFKDTERDVISKNADVKGNHGIQNKSFCSQNIIFDASQLSNSLIPSPNSLLDDFSKIKTVENSFKEYSGEKITKNNRVSILQEFKFSDSSDNANNFCKNFKGKKNQQRKNDHKEIYDLFCEDYNSNKQFNIRESGSINHVHNTYDIHYKNLNNIGKNSFKNYTYNDVRQFDFSNVSNVTNLKKGIGSNLKCGYDEKENVVSAVGYNIEIQSNLKEFFDQTSCKYPKQEYDLNNYENNCKFNNISCIHCSKDIKSMFSIPEKYGLDSFRTKCSFYNKFGDKNESNHKNYDSIGLKNTQKKILNFTRDSEIENNNVKVESKIINLSNIQLENCYVETRNNNSYKINGKEIIYYNENIKKNFSVENKSIRKHIFRVFSRKEIFLYKNQYIYDCSHKLRRIKANCMYKTENRINGKKIYLFVQFNLDKCVLKPFDILTYRGYNKSYTLQYSDYKIKPFGEYFIFYNNKKCLLVGFNLNANKRFDKNLSICILKTIFEYESNDVEVSCNGKKVEILCYSTKLLKNESYKDENNKIKQKTIKKNKKTQNIQENKIKNNIGTKNLDMQKNLNEKENYRNDVFSTPVDGNIKFEQKIEKCSNSEFSKELKENKLPLNSKTENKIINKLGIKNNHDDNILSKNNMQINKNDAIKQPAKIFDDGIKNEKQPILLKVNIDFIKKQKRRRKKNCEKKSKCIDSINTDDKDSMDKINTFFNANIAQNPFKESIINYKETNDASQKDLKTNKSMFIIKQGTLLNSNIKGMHTNETKKLLEGNFVESEISLSQDNREKNYDCFSIDKVQISILPPIKIKNKKAERIENKKMVVEKFAINNSSDVEIKNNEVENSRRVGIEIDKQAEIKFKDENNENHGTNGILKAESEYIVDIKKQKYFKKIFNLEESLLCNSVNEKFNLYDESMMQDQVNSDNFDKKFPSAVKNVPEKQNENTYITKTINIKSVKSNFNSYSLNMKIPNNLPPNFDLVMEDNNAVEEAKDEIQAFKKEDEPEDLRKIVERLTLKIDQDRVEADHNNKVKFKKLLDTISLHLNTQIVVAVENAIKKEIKVGILGIKKSVSESLFAMENKINKLSMEMKDQMDMKNNISKNIKGEPNVIINEDSINKQLKNVMLGNVLPKIEAAVEEMKRQIIENMVSTGSKINDALLIEEEIKTVSIKDDIINLINSERVNDASSLVMDCPDDIFYSYVETMISDEGKNIKKLNGNIMLYMLKRTAQIIQTLNNEKIIEEDETFIKNNRNGAEFIRSILFEIEIQDFENEKLKEFNEILEEIKTIESPIDIKDIVKMQQNYAVKLMKKRSDN